MRRGGAGVERAVEPCTGMCVLTMFRLRSCVPAFPFCTVSSATLQDTVTCLDMDADRIFRGSMDKSIRSTYPPTPPGMLVAASILTLVCVLTMLRDFGLSLEPGHRRDRERPESQQPLPRAASPPWPHRRWHMRKLPQHLGYVSQMTTDAGPGRWGGRGKEFG